ncbi:MAG: hypothetical protein JRN13_06060 [Nitrososphaerota archaeon]|nr:hypothetical protein [Nitrososphaerota archaeon]MDG6937599.1 hypothetical protein [Nitrososphaerota archaeon]MDG6954559.1 hypothetical protein [Nitrososphaerota archaeon]MDG6972879.1 hypothetical protein [Nitrososphaerota archaeon]MDG7018645.1 hypothetical protein [Nitrososphaerota archaeon]
MAGIEVAIRSVEGSKLAEDVTADSSVSFNVAANLVESERNPEKLTLKFTIELNTEPDVAKMTIAGTAVLTGDDKEIDTLLTPKEGESVPPVFMKIYQRVYAVLYLVSGSLKIPYPSPGLLKGVRLVSTREMSQVATPQSRNVMA